MSVAGAVIQHLNQQELTRCDWHWQVRAPAEFQGTVIGDLNRRKGLIQNSEGEDDDVVLVAQVLLELWRGLELWVLVI